MEKELAEIDGKAQDLEEEIGAQKAKLANLKRVLAGLWHKKKSLKKRFASRQLGTWRVSVACEDCGKRFVAKTKKAKRCSGCWKKKRSSWWQLDSGSYGGKQRNQV